MNGSDLDDLLELTNRPTAKRLILSLLSQPNMASLSLRQLAAWGELLGHKPAAIRVTAGRLVKEGLLEKVDRGVYMIGSDGQALKGKAGEWMTALTQICDWQGGWWLAHTAHLSNAVRRKVSARERAFRLLGFKQLVAGLWLRPDNLTHSTSEMHAKLCHLGIEKSTILSRSEDVKQNKLVSPLSLWSGSELNASYDELIELLRRSEQRLSGQDLFTVTKETFVIGEHVIREINADPLLPAECIDTKKRKTTVEEMVRYSEFCHPYWAEFLDTSSKA